MTFISLKKKKSKNWAFLSGVGKFPAKNGSLRHFAQRFLFLIFLFICLVPSKSTAQFRTPAEKNRKLLVSFPRDFLPGCSGDKWIADDKYRHFVGSAFAAAFGYLAMRYYLDRPRKEAIFVGGSFALSLGLGKELRDKYLHAGCASWRDLTADIFGIAFGLIFYTETLRTW